jgi:hypothetical protein
MLRWTTLRSCCDFSPSIFVCGYYTGTQEGLLVSILVLSLKQKGYYAVYCRAKDQW